MGELTEQEVKEGLQHILDLNKAIEMKRKRIRMCEDKLAEYKLLQEIVGRRIELWTDQRLSEINDLAILTMK